MTFHEQMMEKFPIRKSAQQKEEFRGWAVKQGQLMGYSARVEENGKHRNVIYGDPEQAQVIFTAHYDTPAVSFLPNMLTPRNLPVFFGYQLVQVAILFALGIAAAGVVSLVLNVPQLARLVFFVVYFGLLMLMLLGPANKNNANDNTSGVAAVLELMQRLPEEERSKVAFILFDNEEKGKLGSQAYAKAHQKIQHTSLVVNMDCVGVGEHMVFIGGKLARMREEYAVLERVMSQAQERKAHFFGRFGSVCNSDQASFKCSLVVAACKWSSGVGYLVGRIHTKRDTVIEPENITYLAEHLAEFVQQL